MERPTKTYKLTPVVRVSRKRWARGGKGGKASLLNSAGKMCCLGFDANQCGLPKKYLRGWSFPYSLCKPSGSIYGAYDINPVPGLTDAVDFCDGAVAINDDKYITDREREYKLRAHYRAAGRRIVFGP